MLSMHLTVSFFVAPVGMVGKNSQMRKEPLPGPACELSFFSCLDESEAFQDRRSIEGAAAGRANNERTGSVTPREQN